MWKCTNFKRKRSLKDLFNEIKNRFLKCIVNSSNGHALMKKLLNWYKSYLIDRLRFRHTKKKKPNKLWYISKERLFIKASNTHDKISDFVEFILLL